MELVELIQDILNKSKTIAIFGHTRPDGDCAGSALALKHFLIDKFCKNEFDIHLFFDGEISDNIKYLLENEAVNTNEDSCYDLGIALDTQNIDLLGKYKDLFIKSKKTLNLDHHEGNLRYAEHNLIIPKASSTAELLALLLARYSDTLPIEACKNLFVGIITDTNCFTRHNVSPVTYRVVSDLLKSGFDYENIKNMYFKNNSKAKIILLEKALRSLKFFYEDKIAMMRILKSSFDKCSGTLEDTEGIVDYGINTEGVLISCLIIELNEGEYKVSLRSKNDYDVCTVATKFNGGGHKEMASFIIQQDINELANELIKECIEEIKLKDAL